MDFVVFVAIAVVILGVIFRKKIKEFFSDLSAED